MINIYEIKIIIAPQKKNQNSFKFQINVIKSLFFNVFKEDGDFWFLPEPGYFQLRFSENNKEKVIDYCNKQKIIFQDCQPYKETSCDVKDHQEAFNKIMHECSVIALSKEYSPSKLYERIVHCIFLTFSFDFYEKEKVRESTVLCDMAMNRSYTDGVYNGYRSAKYGENNA
jgi:hypothetical protein